MEKNGILPLNAAVKRYNQHLIYTYLELSLTQQWTFCTTRSLGTKSAMLNGRVECDSLQNKATSTSQLDFSLCWMSQCVEVAVLEAATFFAIEHGRFCTMLTGHAKCPYMYKCHFVNVLVLTKRHCSIFNLFNS